MTPAQVAVLLNENVVMHTPVLIKPIVGRELVSIAVSISTQSRDDPGKYIFEGKIDARTTFLRWQGTVEGHKIESLELLTNDENGLLLERTIAYRPFPALKIFRDRLIALNAGRVPDDMWDYPNDLLSKFPGGTSGSALGPPVSLGGGAHDLYVQQEKFPAQFAADVPAAKARIMAVTQRPIVDTAFGEPSGSPAWRSIPSWFIHGTGDKNLPVATVAFMAQRAGAKKVVEIKGASHLVMVSHPKETEKLIVEAASSVSSQQGAMGSSESETGQ